MNFQMIKRSFRAVLPNLDANLLEHIRLLENEIARMNDVLESFMKAAQVSQGQSQPLDLATTIREVVQLLDAEATMAQVTVSYQAGAVLPPLVADASRMRQVLINLLRNAIQAQPDGGAVEISARYACDTARIYLLVQDKGPGVAPELLEKVWRPFFTTKAAGIGLG